MHIWNGPWLFIYEHHNRVPMLLSVTFDEIATLVWNFYWAHKFVARWIIYSCVYFYFWPFRFVAVSVCGHFGLWPFRFVAVPVCGRSGLWPFRSVAVLVCGRFGFGRFGLWPLWPESSPAIRQWSGTETGNCPRLAGHHETPCGHRHNRVCWKTYGTARGKD